MNRLLLPILLLMTACTAERPPLKTGRLNIVLGSPETRAAASTEAEKRIWNAQFLLFDRRGTLCYWHKTVFPEGTAAYSTELTVPTGQVDIWVIANLTEDLRGIPDFNTLSAKKFLLTDNALVNGADGGLVMAGSAGNVLVRESGTTSCFIQVKRLVARVHVGSIHNALPAGRTIASPTLQLSNIAADRTLDSGSMPSRWCNKLLDRGSDLAAQAPFTGGNIAPGADWNCDARLYAYPNPITEDHLGGSVFTPRKTRLVFSCMLGDIRCYYPLTLDRLEENKSYRVDLTLQRPGSADPDIPVESGTFRFTVVPEDWNAPISYEENL